MDHPLDSSIEEMSDADAWAFLTQHSFGRLAYLLGQDINIVPVNYSVAGQRLLIRTAPGSKLLGIVMNPRVAFEVDDFAAIEASSVVVRGTAVHLSPREADATADLQPTTWIPTIKYEVIAIDVGAITGRMFRMA